ITQEQMSERVGKKRSTITNYLRLLRLDAIIQSGIRDGFISVGRGRAIINIEDLDVQTDIYHKIIKESLSVRETEALVKDYHEGLLNQNAAVAKKKMTYIVSNTQQKVFTDFFGAKVDVKISANGKGKINIPFHSAEDLERIIKLLGK